MEPKVHACLRCASTEYELVMDEDLWRAVCRNCQLVAATYAPPEEK